MSLHNAYYPTLLLQLGIVCSAASFSACPRETPPHKTPEAANNAQAPVGEGKRLNATIHITAKTDAGMHHLQRIENTCEIPSETRMLTLQTPLQLTNYRIRLFDSFDRLLPSDDIAQTTQNGLIYRMDLLSPLQPGQQYELIFDAESGENILDEAGHRYDDVHLKMTVKNN